MGSSSTVCAKMVTNRTIFVFELIKTVITAIDTDRCWFLNWNRNGDKFLVE